MQFQTRSLCRIAGVITLIMALGSRCFAVNVKDYGAYGNGVSNDTAAIQAAVDAVKNTGGMVEFPEGTYMVNSVNVVPGLTFHTKAGDATAVIKMVATSNEWTRCFTTTVTGYKYSGDIDSDPLVFANLNFDGNLENQGAYHAYELEHQAAIFLAADKNKAGRLVADIRDCHFVNGAGDAIAINVNVDATIQNCSATNWFRGGFTATGGNTEIYVSDFSTGGDPNPTGFDVEVDGPGYGGSWYCGLTVTNMTLHDGDFDVGFRGDGSYFVGRNITVKKPPFYIFAKDSTVDISNSEFHAGAENLTHIYYPDDVTFKDCTFYALRTTNDTGTSYAPVWIYPNIGLGTQENQKITLDSCEFRFDGGFETNDTICAVRVGASRRERNNTITITNCTIAVGYTHGIYIQQGGTIRVSDVSVAADTAVLIGSSASCFLDVVLNNVSFEEGVDVSEYIVTHSLSNDITHRNITLDDTYNTLGTAYGLEGNNYHGGRRVMGNEAPSAVTPGLVGDYYQLYVPGTGTCEWVCTETDVSAATWEPTHWDCVTPKGTVCNVR